MWPASEDRQRVQELGAEIGAAPAIECQCRQRVHHRNPPVKRPKSDLDAPQRDDEAGLDAILARGRTHQRAVFLEPGARTIDSRLRHHTVEVLAEGEREFGLGHGRAPMMRGIGAIPVKAASSVSIRTPVATRLGA